METKLDINVGDYVFLKNGKFIEITSDEMDGVRYEDIARKATDKENPNFKFDIGAMNELDLEHFWLPFKERCPLAVGMFQIMIDGYKRQLHWDYLIGEGVKFHHLPFEMQFGIIMEFFSETEPEGFPFGFYLFSAKWRKDRNEIIRQMIICPMIQLEIKQRNLNNALL